MLFMHNTEKAGTRDDNYPSTPNNLEVPMRGAILLLWGMSALQNTSPPPVTSWGSYAAHVLPQDSIAIQVSAWSKWITQGNSRVLQVRVEATVVDTVTDSTSPHPTEEDGNAYLRKLEGCTYNLDLTGSDHFPIGHIPLTVEETVNDSGQRTGFTGTGVLKISSTAFQDFIQQKGWWNMTWACPGILR
jgi:hypothetical protein